MKPDDLPQRWKSKIEDYSEAQGSKYKQLSVYDFSDNLDLKIIFEDGSNAFFKDAFYWIDTELKEVAIFTEHCGYHLQSARACIGNNRLGRKYYKNRRLPN